MPKIIRPKPIAPGAPIIRHTFENGDVYEEDAVQHLLKIIEVQARRIEYLNRRLHRGADEANEKRRTEADARDLTIWREHGMLRAILSTGDTALLKRVLNRWKVPPGRRDTFKESNITTTLARRHGVSRPTVVAALEKMKKR